MIGWFRRSVAVQGNPTRRAQTANERFDQHNDSKNNAVACCLVRFT